MHKDMIKNLPDGPENFGPIMWEYLHTYAKSNNYTKEWLDSFTNAIPCPKCKAHFKNISHPKEKDFFPWAVVAHNLINKKLDKKIVKLSEAYKMY
jgi:hypothetical protein